MRLKVKAVIQHRKANNPALEKEVRKQLMDAAKNDSHAKQMLFDLEENDSSLEGLSGGSSNVPNDSTGIYVDGDGNDLKLSAEFMKVWNELREKYKRGYPDAEEARLSKKADLGFYDKGWFIYLKREQQKGPFGSLAEAQLYAENYFDGESGLNYRYGQNTDSGFQEMKDAEED